VLGVQQARGEAEAKTLEAERLKKGSRGEDVGT